MDNKLSELSKPVAWLAIYHGEVYDEAISITRSVVEAQADRFGWESSLTEITPLYSQEYVSALLADNETKDKRIAELEYELACVMADNENCGKTIARKDAAIDTFVKESDEAQKRIAELEAKINHYVAVERASASFDKTADIIKRADDAEREAEELRTRLATPVRLLGEMLLHDWEHSVERQATFQHRKIAWDARLVEDKKAILAAGFTFTVEGDIE